MTRNPVVLKELRSRMRGRRAFVVLTVYLLLLAGFTLLIYGSLAATDAFGGGPGPDLDVVGKTLFYGIVAVELFLVCFVTPAFTAAAISGEREHQTFDLLRTTLLSARSLVFGKLLSALSYVMLLVFAAVPLQSMAFLLGGVGPEEVGISFVLLAASAVAFACLGLFFSSLTRTTLASTVVTYAAALTLIVGIPLLVLLSLSIVTAILDPIFTSTPAMWPLQLALIYLGWFLISTNPVAAAIGTEEVLRSNHTALAFSNTGPAGQTYWLISPWIPFALIYLAASVALYFATVRRVRRAER